MCTGNRARKARPRGVLAGRQLPAPTQSTVRTETPSPPRQRPDPGGQPAPPEAAAWFPGTRPTPGREGTQGRLRTGSPAPPDRPHGRDLSPGINEPQPAPSHVPSQKNVSVPTTAATTTPEQETGADGIVRCRETSLHRQGARGRPLEGRTRGPAPPSRTASLSAVSRGVLSHCRSPCSQLSCGADTQTHTCTHGNVHTCNTHANMQTRTRKHMHATPALQPGCHMCRCTYTRTHTSCVSGAPTACRTPADSTGDPDTPTPGRCVRAPAPPRPPWERAVSWQLT